MPAATCLSQRDTVLADLADLTAWDRDTRFLRAGSLPVT